MELELLNSILFGIGSKISYTSGDLFSCCCRVIVKVVYSKYLGQQSVKDVTDAESKNAEKVWTQQI